MFFCFDGPLLTKRRGRPSFALSFILRLRRAPRAREAGGGPDAREAPRRAGAVQGRPGRAEHGARSAEVGAGAGPRPRGASTDDPPRPDPHRPPRPEPTLDARGAAEARGPRRLAGRLWPSRASCARTRGRSIRRSSARRRAATRGASLGPEERPCTPRRSVGTPCPGPTAAPRPAQRGPSPPAATGPPCSSRADTARVDGAPLTGVLAAASVKGPPGLASGAPRSLPAARFRTSGGTKEQ